ncbi:MAG: hypothetical protein IJ045_07425 [Ruminiclostridium sp.]|nr:hypothetical protein [Ruminiclostridium sp.]
MKNEKAKIIFYNIRKYLFAPLLIWVFTVGYVKLSELIIAPAWNYINEALDFDHRIIEYTLSIIYLIWNALAQLSIVCVFIGIAVRKYNINAKALLVIVPLTYILFALYAPPTFYVLIFTGEWSFLMSTSPALPYWFASVFITVQYGIAMLGAVAATRHSAKKQHREKTSSLPRILSSLALGIVVTGLVSLHSYILFTFIIGYDSIRQYRASFPLAFISNIIITVLIALPVYYATKRFYIRAYHTLISSLVLNLLFDFFDHLSFAYVSFSGEVIADKISYYSFSSLWRAIFIGSIMFFTCLIVNHRAKNISKDNPTEAEKRIGEENQ